ncbi:glycosyltransferase family 4 protein [Haloechinothrix sp. YIM 98757]|uniref:Glycosyltransferase family 4 protein n=1 Tax=Haloechinothrix aidingensis TaxID=2752311 RepID=A0A838AFL6_9PSEU|nr:glycosyltransferase family 4 protein [Haloechinothrix aidingensis]MBA0128089.1 glycosyltransferase family 4 protein [Haloechinothrix aidingensis]
MGANSTGTGQVPPLSGVGIALLNWRDRGHEHAGGAEEYAARIAAALAGAGADVTFVTARGAGQSRHGTDGVPVVRRGGRWTVYPAVLTWLFRHRREIDVVIDCQNGIPFFSPLVTRPGTRVVQVVHHVHADQFRVHFPPWLARIGAWLEGRAARYVYRKAVTVAVSPSTVRAMRARLGWSGSVFVVPNGMDRPLQYEVSRSEEPSLVCLGRLVTHKRVGELIEPVLALRQRWPDLRLHVVGRGPLEQELRAATADLDGAVVVHGYLDDEAKSRLLQSCWLNVTLSDGEGWGLAAVEAATHGLPTVCRDVDGLCDSVRHGETGWLLTDGDDLVSVLDQLLGKLRDPAAADAVARACRQWAGHFDWATSGRRFTSLVSGLLHTGVASGWRQGQHEALVAEFRPPADEQRLKWAVARVGVGATFGITGESGWLLAEQHAAGDLVTVLHEAGATDVAVRPAEDIERLLGRARRTPMEVRRA